MMFLFNRVENKNGFTNKNRTKNNKLSMKGVCAALETTLHTLTQRNVPLSVYF